MLQVFAYAAGRALSYALAKEGQKWRAAAAARMPEARGDVRQIVGQPVFVPLYKLFLTYGKVRQLALQFRSHKRRECRC